MFFIGRVAFLILSYRAKSPPPSRKLYVHPTFVGDYELLYTSV